MKSILSKLRRAYLLVIGAALIAANVLVFAPLASATALVTPEVLLTNMNATGNSALIIKFTTSASNTGTSLTLALPSFTVSASQTYSANYTGVSCTVITGATSALPGAPTASGSGTTITFAGITSYTASHSYCGVLTGTAVTNPSAGSYTGTLTAGTDAAAPIAVYVISSDQVVVTAQVPASFTLALTGGGTDPFSPLALSTGSINSTSGITATVGTNGTGWVLYGQDSNTGLLSAATSHTISSTTPGTTATLSFGSEGYVTAVTSTGNTVVGAWSNPSFATNGKGSGLNTTLVQLVSGTGPVSSTTAQFKEYATISGSTPAANDYTDTITLIGAGTF